MIIIWILFSLLIIALCIVLSNIWIKIYNKLQYWYTRAQRHFADVAVVLQLRLDNIHALTQMAEKYRLHEYQTLKTVIEARSKWSSELNENVQRVSDVEYNYSKLQALLEKYPELKADQLYTSLMERDTKIENQIRQTRISFNYDAQRYNEITRRFPHNIIAATHNFRELYYLVIPKKSYEPAGIFKTS